MSAMYGQAIADGAIDVSKTLRELAVGDTNPALSPEEKQATIGELLMARSGGYHVAQGESPGMSAARPKRFGHPHGTFWYYNNWDFNALGTIFNKLTRKSLFDFLADRIATPIGMEDFKRAEQAFIDQGQSSTNTTMSNSARGTWPDSATCSWRRDAGRARRLCRPRG
jgi:CubicO group peptidase (beta-lactamase class C family)